MQTSWELAILSSSKDYLSTSVKSIFNLVPRVPLSMSNNGDPGNEVGPFPILYLGLVPGLCCQEYHEGSGLFR